MEPLFIKIDKVENAKAVVVINHGFAEHVGRYDHVTKYLVQSGYSVYRYDLRGHGQSKTIKGHIDSYEEFISDAKRMVDLARKDNPNLDIFILGHSMGGLVSAMYGLEYPDTIKGEILIGPALKDMPQIRGGKKKWVTRIGNLLPNTYIPNIVGDDICSKQEVVDAYKQDPLVIKKMTLGFIKAFLVDAGDYISLNEHKYSLPVLILHGEADKVVPQEISASFYRNIASKDKTRITYPDLYHEILNEDAFEEIMQTIVKWLGEHIEGE